MPSPDEIFSNWKRTFENDFSETISRTFELDPTDSYVYRAESFAMTMPQIQKLLNSGDLKYKYQSHGKELDVRITCRILAKMRHSTVLTDFKGHSCRYYRIHFNLFSVYGHFKSPDFVRRQCKETVSSRNRSKLPSIAAYFTGFQSP